MYIFGIFSERFEEEFMLVVGGGCVGGMVVEVRKK